jgi:hypothetical protein
MQSVSYPEVLLQNNLQPYLTAAEHVVTTNSIYLNFFSFSSSPASTGYFLHTWWQTGNLLGLEILI